MNIEGVKVFSGFLFFFIAFFFGCLPFFVFRRCFSATNSQTRKPGQHNMAVQYLHALASGVLIATCLLHLLPESLENVQRSLSTHTQIAGQQKTHHGGQLNIELESNSSKVPLGSHLSRSTDQQDSESSWSSYPVAELLVSIGFLFIYIVDTTIKSFQHDRHQYGGDGTFKYSRLQDIEDDDGEIDVYIQKLKPSSTRNGESRDRNQSNPNRDEKSLVSRSGGDVDLEEDDNNMSQGVIHNSYNNNSKRLSSDSMSLDKDSRASGGEALALSSERQKESGHVRCFALVLALSIHGFFDGVMLGLQTSISVLYSLLLALSLHKSFVATSLSITLLKNYASINSLSRVIVYVTAFASVAPLGLAASAAFIHSSLVTSQENDDVGIIPGCIQAFAVGTFLYVTFTEATSRHDGEKRCFKTELVCHVFLLLGFVFMALMRLTFSDD